MQYGLYCDVLHCTATSIWWVHLCEGLWALKHDVKHDFDLLQLIFSTQMTSDPLLNRDKRHCIKHCDAFNLWTLIACNRHAYYANVTTHFVQCTLVLLRWLQHWCSRVVCTRNLLQTNQSSFHKRSPTVYPGTPPLFHKRAPGQNRNHSQGEPVPCRGRPRSWSSLGGREAQNWAVSRQFVCSYNIFEPFTNHSYLC